jgi:hypothetical protein
MAKSVSIAAVPSATDRLVLFAPASCAGQTRSRLVGTSARAGVARARSITREVRTSDGAADSLAPLSSADREGVRERWRQASRRAAFAASRRGPALRRLVSDTDLNVAEYAVSLRDAAAWRWCGPS